MLSPTFDFRERVRMLRDTKHLTQQQLADAAGVSLSTIRRMEREADARFHPTTERDIEFVLGLRLGGLEHLRQGGDVDNAFESRHIIRFPRSFAYGTAPLSDIAATGGYLASVMANGLEKLLANRGEELALLASGKLTTARRDLDSAFLFGWLPWPARAWATPIWLDRFMDSAEQVRLVLEEGPIPRPLRMAEAVALHIAHDHAWAVDTNAFFDPDTHDELDDPLVAIDDLYDDADPRPLFNRERPESEWVSPDSDLHPARWWMREEWRRVM